MRMWGIYWKADEVVFLYKCLFLLIFKHFIDVTGKRINKMLGFVFFFMYCDVNQWESFSNK